MFYKGLCISLVVLAGSFLSSCAVTTAPTEASSATIGNTSEASTDLTSSTSIGDDDNQSEDAAAKEFIGLNFDRLRSDMAVGEGEYLTSLAVLLGIDETEKAGFYTMTRNNFSQLFTSSNTTPEELFTRLEQQVQVAQI